MCFDDALDVCKGPGVETKFNWRSHYVRSITLYAQVKLPSWGRFKMHPALQNYITLCRALIWISQSNKKTCRLGNEILHRAIADHVTAYVDSEAGHVDHEKRFI